MIGTLIIAIVTIGVAVAFWLDYNDDMKRQLRYRVNAKQRQERMNGEKEWPTLLDWFLGLLFVVGFFGVFSFMGHAAGF